MALHRWTRQEAIPARSETGQESRISFGNAPVGEVLCGQDKSQHQCWWRRSNYPSQKAQTTGTNHECLLLICPSDDRHLDGQGRGSRIGLDPLLFHKNLVQIRLVSLLHFTHKSVSVKFTWHNWKLRSKRLHLGLDLSFYGFHTLHKKIRH